MCEVRKVGFEGPDLLTPQGFLPEWLSHLGGFVSGFQVMASPQSTGSKLCDGTECEIWYYWSCIHHRGMLGLMPRPKSHRYNVRSVLPVFGLVVRADTADKVCTIPFTNGHWYSSLERRWLWSPISLSMSWEGLEQANVWRVVICTFFAEKYESSHMTYYIRT